MFGKYGIIANLVSTYISGFAIGTTHKVTRFIDGRGLK